MAQLAKSGYCEEDIEDLCVVTRVAVEVYAWLKDFNINSLEQNKDEVEYNCETVLWSINTFIKVCGDYSVLIGTIPSQIDWGVISVASLKKLIIATYERFDAENVFLKKCRILLDLYRMELVLAGLVYRYPE